MAPLPQRRATADRLLRAERSRLFRSRHGALRVGLGYPNTYHVAQSSLAFQWVTELTAQVSDVGAERFFGDPELAGTTLDDGAALGEMHILAWSCSFELDAVNLLRVLDAAGIPRLRAHRSDHHPLLVMGGPLATINPLPLVPVIDVFCLGAAELLWTQLLELTREHRDRDRLLTELAERDGFLVPALHVDSSGRPLRRVRRVEKRSPPPGHREPVPASHLVTPHTVYRNRGLVEISRGCPERCRYCWISHASGHLRCYPAEDIIARVDELATLSNRIGLVATAVGDHPELAEVLEHGLRRGLDIAVSSLRIPALVPEVLAPLAASGARSLTIAPETGSDALRRAMNKRISNHEILAGLQTARACGIESVKMYFIVGLPGETDQDLEEIAGLARAARDTMLTGARRRFRAPAVQVAINPLVPKPYTPYFREAMLDRGEWRRRTAVVERRLKGMDGVKVQRASYREALWQGFLSRGNASAYRILERAARGIHLGRVLVEHRTEIEAGTLRRVEGEPAWHFITRAPVVHRP